MAKPPPPPPSKAARAQLQVFGDAFEAAVSKMDGEAPRASEGPGDSAGPSHERPSHEPVYANDLEMRGVYTGPYSQVESPPTAYESPHPSQRPGPSGLPGVDAGVGAGEPVYANDLELRGVYTGPYTHVSERPPSLDHLGSPGLQTLETTALPLQLQNVESEVGSGGPRVALFGLVALVALGGLAFGLSYFGVL